METVFFLVVFLIAAWLALGLLWRLKASTRRRGSRYYVPTFKASFDSWDSKWTMSRRWNEQQDKARWQKEFDRRD